VILFILYLIGGLAMNLGALVQRGLAVRRYASQKTMRIPNAMISQQGVYDEHEGYESWRWLHDVSYRDERGDKGQAIVFKFFRPASSIRRLPSAEWRVETRVPPGQAGEAQLLVSRVKTEILRN